MTLQLHFPEFEAFPIEDNRCALAQYFTTQWLACSVSHILSPVNFCVLQIICSTVHKNVIQHVQFKHLHLSNSVHHSVIVIYISWEFWGFWSTVADVSILLGFVYDAVSAGDQSQILSLRALGSSYLLMQHHITEKLYLHLYLPCSLL